MFSFGFYGIGGGGIGGSTPLAQILYTNTLGKFVYSTDENGNTILANQGSLDADGLLNTGRALELGATNELPIPIYNNGGTGSFLTYYDFSKSEYITIGNSADGGSSINFLDGVEWISGAGETETNGDLSWDGSQTGLSVSYTQDKIPTHDGGLIRLTYDVANYVSGYVYRSMGGSGAQRTANGSYEEIVTISVDSTLQFRANVDFIGDVINIRTEQILPNKTTYSFLNQTLNSILKNSTPFSTEDKAKLNANPQLMAKLALSPMGTIDELDMVLINTDDYYACADRNSGTITDARNGTTTNISNWTSTIETNADFQPKGLQTTCLVLNSIGIPTDYTEDRLVKNDNQFITLPLDTPLDYTPTKDIDNIEGDSTSLTITHTDATTVVVP